MQTFIYHTSDGFINVNTLSPSNKFYYRLQPAQALNPSAFGCKIAFYDISEKLIYHRSKVYAHELHSKEEIKLAYEEMKSRIFNKRLENDSIEVVKWSIQGNLAYFLEFYNRNYQTLFESVFLNLNEEYCFRINELQNNFEIVDHINLKDRLFDENEVIKKLENLGLQREEVIKDKVNKNFLASLLTKWYPNKK